MTTCQHCGAETSNGLTLCNLCQRFTITALEYLPIYFRNLSRWQPGRAGSRPVPGSRVLYDGHDHGQGTGDRISDRLDETALMLTEAADKLADARSYLRRLLDRLADAEEAGTVDDAESVSWLCRGFIKHLPAIATLDWAGAFVTDIAHHEELHRNLTNECVPGWYAGACRKCESGTFAVPGLTWVTCGGCGTTTYARDHLDTLIDEASEWLERPKQLAVAIVALVDTEPSIDRLYTRIRQWAHQGNLDAVHRSTRDYVWSTTENRLVVGTVNVGPARYRMGDVLQLVLRDTRSLTSQVS